MLNVYPCELTYVRTSNVGVLAGIPCPCVIGVASEQDGEKLFEDLVKNNPDISFTNPKINKRK